jgi:hypothetical protein
VIRLPHLRLSVFIYVKSLILGLNQRTHDHEFVAAVIDTLTTACIGIQPAITTPTYSSSQAIYPQCIYDSSGQQNWAVPLEVRLQMVVTVLARYEI